MNSEVIVFTLDGCSHCLILKSRLNEESIPFTEIEISLNEKIWDKVVEQTGHNVLPTVFINPKDSDTGPIFVPGTDYQNPDDLIPKIKKLLLK
jgi:glutaredoxin